QVVPLSRVFIYVTVTIPLLPSSHDQDGNRAGFVFPAWKSADRGSRTTRPDLQNSAKTSSPRILLPEDRQFARCWWIMTKPSPLTAASTVLG
ncbi:unnamed protein product, partial [Ectocarpus sp. 6 AP-2014]